MPSLETYQGIYLWQYVPSLPAAIIFVIMFGLATAVHCWKMLTTRMWFCLPFVIGGICEVIGYISRAAAYNSTGNLVPYILQAIFLVLAPVFFAASLYMVYSRIVRAVHGEIFSPISRRWTTVTFVLSDLICLNVQSYGSGLLVKPKRTKLGNYIITAGLGVQVLIFIIFILYCLVFNVRYRAHLAETGAVSSIPWQSCLNMLYSTSLAILVRNAYRIAEFIMGRGGYLLRNEWPVYVFDGALMFLVMIGFLVWHPSQLLLKAGESMVELMADESPSIEHDCQR